MVRILLSKRWVILSLVTLALMPAFYRLGMWQFHRYQQTNRNNQVINANIHAQPTPFGELSKPGGNVPAAEMYRRVSATGSYDQAHEFVVRQRTDASGDNLGFYVVTPLRTAGGDIVLVNRGWVQPNNSDGNAYPSTVPPAPKGTVTVTGLFRPDETPGSTGIRERSGLPPRQFQLINSGEQSGRLHQPVDTGYLELNATSPAPPASELAEQVPGPTVQNNSMAVVGKGVHLPYAIQWWIFTAMLPIAWFVLLRREVKERREQAGKPQGSGPSPTGDPNRASPAAVPE